MQERRFFFKRFWEYQKFFVMPVLLILVLISALIIVRESSSLDKRCKDILDQSSTSLDLTLNDLMLQNRQFTNNPYMILSLKHILAGNPLSYTDVINMRGINAAFQSLITTHPYISDVSTYLDGFGSAYSSHQGVFPIDKDKDKWFLTYEAMPKDSDTMAVLLSEEQNGETKYELMLYQRLLMQDGVVMMRINTGAYSQMIGKLAGDESGILIFFNTANQILFSCGDKKGLAKSIDISKLPGEDERGQWADLKGERYLFNQKINDTYNIRIVSLMPAYYRTKSLEAMLPYLGMLIASGLIMVLIVAYYTTRQNFRHIRQILTLLEHAEQGQLEDNVKGVATDEYDVILKNIVYLHLQTEQLNTQLEQKKHAHEVATLGALQAQINPHFMFNTLHMIRLEALSGVDGAASAAKMTEELADILKYALADPLQPITLEEEIRYLKEYISIQKKRFGEQFIIYYEIDEGLEDFLVFRLMLQPIIENSILHGIRKSARKGYIKLRVYRREGRVYFRVFDTGCGIGQEELEKLRETIRKQDFHNVGLANVNNRLMLYYGDEAAIHIESRQGRGCVVWFSIPEEIVKNVDKS